MISFQGSKFVFREMKTDRSVTNVDYCKFINVRGINVCVFETKLCSRRLIFVVSSGLATYLDT